MVNSIYSADDASNRACPWLIGSTPSFDNVSSPEDYTTDVYRQGIDQLHELDYEIIEMPHVGHLSVNDSRFIRDYAAGYGMQIMSVHADVCMGYSPKAIDAYRRLHDINIRNTIALQAGIIVEHTNAAYENCSFERECKRFEESIKNAQSAGLITAIENTADDIWLIKNLLEYFKSHNVGFCFDIGHANLGSIGVVELVKLFADRLVHIHAHDNRGTFDAHLPIGHGTVDWMSVFENIADIQYSGVIIFEVASQFARNNDPESICRRVSLRQELIQSMSFLKDFHWPDVLTKDNESRTEV